MMGDNKRLFVLLGIGALLIVGLLAFQLLSSGEDGGSKRVVAVPAPAGRSVTSVPAAGSPTTASVPGSSDAPSSAGRSSQAATPAPSVTVPRPARDPFTANF